MLYDLFMSALVMTSNMLWFSFVVY